MASRYVCTVIHWSTAFDSKQVQTSQVAVIKDWLTKRRLTKISIQKNEKLLPLKWEDIKWGKSIDSMYSIPLFVTKVRIKICIHNCCICTRKPGKRPPKWLKTAPAGARLELLFLNVYTLFWSNSAPYIICSKQTNNKNLRFKQGPLYDILRHGSRSWKKRAQPRKLPSLDL